MTARPPRRGTTAAGVGVIILGAASMLVLGIAPPARSAVAFTAAASADSIKLVVAADDFPATKTPVDSAGPASRVTLSTSDSGTAYAAAPDPGAFLAALPGLGAGVLAQNVQGGLPFTVPGYPLTASADSQNPSQTVGGGAYLLEAEVDASTARASTVTGGSGPVGNTALVNAVSEITSAMDAVVAKARSNIEGLTVGPLTIGLVRSEARASADQTGTVTRSSDLVVDGMRIGNLPIGLSESGLLIAGQGTPAGSDAAVDAALAAAGITVTRFPEVITPTGVTGAGLIIVQKLPVPTFGPTTLTYRIGGVSANVLSADANAAVPDALTPGSAVPGDVGAGPALPGTATDLAGAVGVPGAVPGSTAEAPSATRPLGGVALSSGPALLSPANGERLYLLLAGAGLVGLLGMTVVRIRGVKLA